ncbi:MAG: hypothetical protein ACRDH9_09265 [Actinomycetota bacterium]
MTLPQPSVLVEAAKALQGDLHRLVSDYKWAHSIAFGGKSSHPTSEEIEAGKTVTKESISWSDPTGQAAVDYRRHVRSNLGHAAGALQRATRQIDAGLRSLSEILGGRSPGKTPESTYHCQNLRCQNVTHGPRGQHGDECKKCRKGTLEDVTGSKLVSGAEYAESVEAKRRREARGQGWGDA